MAHILITRPEPEASKFAKALSGLGHEATTVPLLQIQPLDDVSFDLTGVQALIVTSANCTTF